MLLVTELLEALRDEADVLGRVDVEEREPCRAMLPRGAPLVALLTLVPGGCGAGLKGSPPRSMGVCRFRHFDEGAGSMLPACCLALVAEAESSASFLGELRVGCGRWELALGKD